MAYYSGYAEFAPTDQRGTCLGDCYMYLLASFQVSVGLLKFISKIAGQKTLFFLLQLSIGRVTFRFWLSES